MPQTSALVRPSASGLAPTLAPAQEFVHHTLSPQINVPAREFHTDLKRDEIRSVLAPCRAGTVTALAAPRVLDEGMDVPDPDPWVFLATRTAPERNCELLDAAASKLRACAREPAHTQSLAELATRPWYVV